MARIIGQVQNPTGGPIQNIKVSINGQSATTDSNGEFRVGGLSAGRYTIRISPSGWSPKSDTIDLNENETVKPTYILRRTTF